MWPSHVILLTTKPGFTMGNSLSTFSLSWELKVRSSWSPKYWVTLECIGWCYKILLKLVLLIEITSRNNTINRLTRLQLYAKQYIYLIYILVTQPCFGSNGCSLFLHEAPSLLLPSPDGYLSINMGVGTGLNIALFRT